MDTLLTKAEAALMLPAALPTSRRMAEIERIRLEAQAARDAAIAAGLRRAARATFRFFMTIGAALRAWPRRIETYNALQALSDRQLRDIGMTRSDIGRVFEPGFAPRPANDPGEKPAPRAA